VVAPGAVRLQGLDEYVRQKFPGGAVRDVARNGVADVLIAGCGTGQNSIGVARNLAARVLALDLSLSSLSYAIRKTREIGLINVEYAQADILGLASLSRSFDLIDASGVLHHLADRSRACASCAR